MPVEYSLSERNRIANDMFGDSDIIIKAYSNNISGTGTGGTEITADGYTPFEIANDTTNFPLATTGTRANAVEFEKTLTEAATVTSIGIFADPSGDFIGRRVFSPALSIEAGQSLRFPIGSISYTPQNVS